LSKEDVRLDDLLARGSLGGPQYDQILQRVLERTARDGRPRVRRWIRWAVVPGGAFAAAFAVWLAVGQSERGGFAPKGGLASLPAGGALEISCAPSGSRICRLGSTLMVTANTALVSGYLTAYAERAGDPAHGRIWYFPTASGAAPLVQPGDGTVVVPEGIRIGPEHGPGTYRVTLLVSSRPLDRAAVDSVDDGSTRSRSIFELQVVP
jgi:hypothetical protein